MGFIILLGLGAFILASVSGFFSVWGLAQTYSGIFWFVISMGVAIEYGKLISISYIYRFWNKGPALLNYYLLSAVAAVMLVTAAGHYGFLTSGYQSDSLPLKQVQGQIELLDQERIRLQERKIQIDTQIAQLPTNSIRGKVRLMNQFKSEQQSTTARLTQLDKDLLELKQKQITTEAHTGPIVFLAKAFGLDTDKATHYLTILLILVFDPLAVALTWATNVAIRERSLKLDVPVVESFEPSVTPPDDPVKQDEPFHVLPPEPVDEPVPEPNTHIIPEPVTEAVEDIQPTQASVAPPTTQRLTRPYPGLDVRATRDVSKLLEHYKYLKAKKEAHNAQDMFTNDDAWELSAIGDALRKEGLDQYLQ